MGGGAPADGLGDGKPGTQAALDAPAFIALDDAGNLFVADQRHLRVRRLDAVTSVVTTVAGGGAPPDGRGDGLPATQAAFLAPDGLTFDSAGTLFVTDIDDDRVRKVPGVGMTPVQSLTASLANVITTNVPAALQPGLLTLVQQISTVVANLNATTK